MSTIHIDGAVGRIQLNKGREAVIDVGDVHVVAQFKWAAYGSPPYTYVSTRVDGRSGPLYLHRWLTGAPDGTVVDHINHDVLDNRRANLRVCTQHENARNSERCEVVACPSGHPYDELNTHINKKGHRICRECARLRMRDVISSETPDKREHRRLRTRAYYIRTRQVANPRVIS